MIAEPLLPLARPVEGLKFLPGNPRRGDVAACKRSLKRFGQRKPIVVRDDGTVEAGNTTLRAALELGWSEIACVAFGDDDATAKAFALADNRTSELGSFDADALLAMASEVDAVDPELLLAASYDLAELTGARPGKTDPDAVPEPPAEPVTQPGDLWQLGPHRLLCGDADDVTAHERLLGGERPDLIFTDPPYGMSLDTAYSGMHKANHIGKGGNDYRPVEGDDKPYDAAPLIAMYDDVREQFWWGADYYRTTIPAGGSWVVWDKRANDQDMNLDKLLGAHFELCWSRQQHHREIARVLWSGHHGMQREDTRKRVHPTQKPVGLVTWFFDRWHGDVVLDLYAGSGSTLIAAHSTRRTARLMELDPAYCDVICARYEQHTGTRAELVTP